MAWDNSTFSDVWFGDTRGRVILSESIPLDSGLALSLRKQEQACTSLTMLISISLMYTCQLYPTPTHRHDTLALPSTERVAWRRAKTHSTAPPQKEGSSALVRPSSLIA